MNQILLNSFWAYLHYKPDQNVCWTMFLYITLQEDKICLNHCLFFVHEKNVKLYKHALTLSSSL
jgi:hypothetical protein